MYLHWLWIKWFRGAVLLDKGTFELNESLRISVSGVVLRGSDREQTVLLKKGVDRGALLYIEDGMIWLLRIPWMY